MIKSLCTWIQQNCSLIVLCSQRCDKAMEANIRNEVSDGEVESMGLLDPITVSGRVPMVTVTLQSRKVQVAVQ